MKEKITFKQSLIGEAYSPEEQRTIQQYAGDERRMGGERRADTGVNQFLDAMSQHMHQVRKALAARQYDIAAKLVNSAISSLEKNRS